MTAYVFPMAWGLLVLASWAGWGQWVECLLRSRAAAGNVDARPDIGLRTGWGMTVVLFFGGLLNAAGLCSPSAVIAIVMVGLVGLAFGRRSHGGVPSLDPQAAGSRWGYLPVVLLLALVYTASVNWKMNWNAGDDFLAYNLFPVEMLHRGAAVDPFSWRRLSTLGGYAYLQSNLAVVAWPQTAFQLDIGLGSILSVLLLTPPLRRRGVSPLVASLPGILCVLLPLGRINSMSSQLGVAGFLTLVRTMQVEAKAGPATRFRLGWIAGAVGTAIVTLRPNFLPVVGAAFVFNGILRLWAREISVRSAVIDFACAAGGGLVCLVPWSIALHHAGNSYFYPIFRGNDHGGADLLVSSLSGLKLARFVVMFFLRPKMLGIVLLGLIAFVGWKRQVMALWAAAMVGATLTVIKLSAGDYPNLTRYALPALTAAAVAAVAAVASVAVERRTRGGRSATAAIGVLVVAMVVYNCVAPAGLMRDSVYSLVHATEPIYAPQLPQQYADVQQHIPAGKTVLASVNFPFLFDQRRNTVFSADEPGIASPGAGIPLTGSTQAVLDYLRANSIDYLVCENFDTNPGFLNRPEWTAIAASDNVINRRTAAYILAAMNCFDRLAAQSPGTIQSNGLRVVPIR